MHTFTLCPCGSNQAFSECCELFLNGTEKPNTAEQLMRSRYCAFVTQNEAYLLNTWHESSRPHSLGFDTHTKWLGLKVKRSKAGLMKDHIGWVEFAARYKVNGKAERIDELSYFVKKDDQWLYVCAENKAWDTL